MLNFFKGAGAYFGVIIKMRRELLVCWENCDSKIELFITLEMSEIGCETYALSSF